MERRRPDGKEADAAAATVAISALTGEGLPELLTQVEGMLEAEMAHVSVLIPYEQGELVDLFHRRGLIEEEDHTARGTRIKGLLPRELVGHFQGVRRERPSG